MAAKRKRVSSNVDSVISGLKGKRYVAQNLMPKKSQSNEAKDFTFGAKKAAKRKKKAAQGPKPTRAQMNEGRADPSGSMKRRTKAALASRKRRGVSGKADKRLAKREGVLLGTMLGKR